MLSAGGEELAPAVHSILAAARERGGSDERVTVESRSLSDAFAAAEADGRVPVIAEVKPTSPATEGVLHGARSKVLQDGDGQIMESHRSSSVPRRRASTASSSSSRPRNCSSDRRGSIVGRSAAVFSRGDGGWSGALVAVLATSARPRVRHKLTPASRCRCSGCSGTAGWQRVVTRGRRFTAETASRLEYL